MVSKHTAGAHPRGHDLLSKSEIAALMKLERGMVVAEFGDEGSEFTETLRTTVGERGAVHLLDPTGRSQLAPTSCDRVLMVNLWDASDPTAILNEARRILRPKGCLMLVQGHASADGKSKFDEVIQVMEHNRWDVHRHGDTGDRHFYVEAEPTDESVQS